MDDIKQLSECGFLIQQINQLIQINERGYDIVYLGPDVLEQNILRYFLKQIDKYNSQQRQLIKYGIEKNTIYCYIVVHHYL